MSEFQALDKFFADVDFVVPGHEKSSQYMVAIHQEFYKWASERVRDDIVLEAGCGEGYGAQILADAAKKVIAIDIKPELIQHACDRYPGPDLEFGVMDCEAMTFPSESFDVVICNELIEHLIDYTSFLRGARRVLKPRGRLICATTNEAISFDKGDGSPLNRNHFQEFNGETFVAELRQCFSSVELFSQLMNEEFHKFTFDQRARTIEWWLLQMGIKHKIPIRLRNFVRQHITGVNLSTATERGFEIVEGGHKEAVYLIGVATK